MESLPWLSVEVSPFSVPDLTLPLSDASLEVHRRRPTPHDWESIRPSRLLVTFASLWLDGTGERVCSEVVRKFGWGQKPDLRRGRDRVPGWAPKGTATETLGLIDEVGGSLK